MRKECERLKAALVEAEDLHTAIQEQGGGAVEAMLAERLAEAEEAVRAKDNELDRAEQGKAPPGTSAPMSMPLKLSGA